MIDLDIASARCSLVAIQRGIRQGEAPAIGEALIGPCFDAGYGERAGCRGLKGTWT
jgi:hypothetical protein